MLGGYDAILTPPYYRERNTVQHMASHRGENRLDMRDLQAPANPCNTLFLTRNEQVSGSSLLVGFAILL